MSRNISRREVVRAAGTAALGMVAASVWTGTAKAATPPAPEPATGAADTAAPAALFPWIGI
jgi:hypothetical protein